MILLALQRCPILNNDPIHSLNSYFSMYALSLSQCASSFPLMHPPPIMSILYTFLNVNILPGFLPILLTIITPSSFITPASAFLAFLFNLLNLVLASPVMFQTFTYPNKKSHKHKYIDYFEMFFTNVLEDKNTFLFRRLHNSSTTSN